MYKYTYLPIHSIAQPKLAYVWTRWLKYAVKCCRDTSADRVPGMGY